MYISYYTVYCRTNEYIFCPCDIISSVPRNRESYRLRVFKLDLQVPFLKLDLQVPFPSNDTYIVAVIREEIK